MARRSQFTIGIDQPETVQSAKFLIGIHRRGGMSEPLKVKVNDTPIPVDMGDANEFSEFFAPLDAAIPTSVLQDENNIMIQSQAGSTITSVQIEAYRKLP